LVYYEASGDPENAISREKQIKAGSRDKKMKLIAGMNPRMLDLYDRI
jgi:putative endonuclease